MISPELLRQRLGKIERDGLYRRRRVLDSPQGAIIEMDGRKLVNFCSNDYLGLANHPDVVAAFCRATKDFGVGSGSAHLVCGHGRAHHQLEEELAAFTGRDRALLFSTGYMANLGVISALVGRGDTVFEDRLNHASLLDAARLSGARLKRFRHRNLAELETALEQSESDRTLIASDGVFSMEGDLAPVKELASLARRLSCWLMIDDAHGVGVLGERGAGLLEQQGMRQAEVPILMGTLGKALGTFGAFVAGSEELIEFLIQQARTYVYTTALPPAVAAATRVSLALAIKEGWRRDRLARLVRQFRAGATTLGLQLMESSTPVQPVLVGDNEVAVKTSEKLREAGFLVTAIRPPTVPVGTARLRITLTATHDESQLDRLLDVLGGIMARHRADTLHSAVGV